MKRDHFQTRRPRRPLGFATAVLAAALCGLLGLKLGMESQDSSSVADPGVRPTFHESVFRWASALCRAGSRTPVGE